MRATHVIDTVVRSTATMPEPMAQQLQRQVLILPDLHPCHVMPCLMRYAAFPFTSKIPDTQLRHTQVKVEIMAHLQA